MTPPAARRAKSSLRAEPGHGRGNESLAGPICVTGASGFIGRHLCARLVELGAGPVHCLVRSPGVLRGEPRLALTGGDVRDAALLERFLRPAATVFNLAFDRTATLDVHVKSARTLAQACEARGVARLVHLSTATVVGVNRAHVIDERTPCLPVSAYDRSKLAIEDTLMRALKRTKLVIVRPTAVFGPGGRNVVKLAGELAAGGAAARYLRACFHGRRPLNLVSIENVIGALVFLADANVPATQRIHIVTDGEARTNNYLDVERALARAFGHPDHHLPVVALPPPLRDLVLRAAGRAEAHSERRFTSAALATLGHVAPVPFESALHAYADYLAAQFRRHGRVTG